MISKWGNVDVRVIEDEIIIKPIRQSKIKYDLSALCEQIPQNYTSQEEFSTPMGREEW